MNNLFHRKCQERETFHVEPTQADNEAKWWLERFEEICGAIVIGFTLLVLGGWMPELWRFAQ